VLLAHVVLACAVVESSSRKTRKITYYYLLIFGYYGEFAWLGTREDATRHLQTLIESSTSGDER
jgi:aminopeptidase-like protein